MTDTQHRITIASAIESLRKAVAEKGEDYVYQPKGTVCFYAEPDGSPSCIVGHVFADLDPEFFQKLAEYEQRWWPVTVAAVLWRDNGPLSHPDVDPADRGRVGVLLGAAQSAQDRGLTWGEALERGLHDLGVYVRLQNEGVTSAQDES